MTVAYDLTNTAFRGLIREDVMEEIFAIDPVDLPYMDMASRGTASNPYKEWTKESLAAPSLPTAIVDGAAAPAASTFTEERIGDHCEINAKTVAVSDRANDSNTIGYANRMVHELMIRQKELKRSMESGLLSNKASVAPTGSVAGQYAGCGAMFQGLTGAAGTGVGPHIINGSAGGFSAGIFSAPTPGAAAAMTEANVRLAMSSAYKAGGNPRIMMSVPDMIEKFSSYLFTASARIATMMSQNTTVKTDAYGKQGITAVGSVNTFVTDFGTLELIPNRTQLQYTVSATTTCCNVYLFDPDYWEVAYLQGIQVKELGETGLTSSRMMSVDYTNCALQYKSSAVLMGQNTALAVTA